MKTINIGIIGTGFGSRVQVPGFKSIPGVRVLALAGTSLEKTAAIAKENGIPLYFDSWKELVRHPDIDAVSIATPPHLHKEMALFAAKHGKHIFCEKPLAVSVAEARAMLAAAKKAKRVHMTDFEFRNVPYLEKFAALVRSGIIGEIRHVNISWLSGGRAGMGVPLSWQNDKRAGGGTLFAFGSHIIDYVELIFGHVRRVSGSLSIAKKNGATAEDTCDILMELKNSALVNISVSNVMPNGQGHTFEAYGSAGSLRLVSHDPGDLAHGFRLFHFSTKTGQEVEVAVKRAVAAKKFKDSRIVIFVKTAKEFVNAIRQKRNANPSFVDGLRVQVIMDAIQKSDRTKRWVSVSS